VDKAQLERAHEALIALQRYENTVKSQKITMYKPLPKGQQGAFFENQTDRFRLVLGGNRSGKTTLGYMEANAHSLGYRPWLPSGHPLRVVRLTNGQPIPVPNIGRILAQNYEQAIQQTIIKKFDEWAPKRLVKKIRYNSRQIPTAIEWTNGSIMYLLSNDQDDMAFEGPSGHWFWFDEPCDYRKYTGLSRGLVDYAGHAWGTMTPLSQPWINEILASRAGDPGSGISLYKLSIWDNCDECGGYLTRTAIEAFLSDLREDELEARLHGNFLHLAGLVYKEWEPRPPFWVQPREIPDSWPRVCVVDPHTRKPLAMLWAACSPSDTWYIYRTIEDPSIKIIKDAAERIMYVEGWESHDQPGPEAEPVVLRIIDWSSQEVDRTSGDSIRDRFTQINRNLVHVLAKKHDAQFGYDAIHEALQMKREWDQPGLIVFNGCTGLKDNFMNFCFDEWGTNRQRDKMGEKQTYRKYNDDFIDCVRYIFQHKLNYAMLKRMMNAREEKMEYGLDMDMSHNGSIFTRNGTRTGIGGA